MESVINDVELLDLAVIPTDGGPVMHMMRPASPLFGEIGEVYFSEVEPGCVKAWKCHTRQTQRFAVPVGQLKIVLYDDRPESPTRGRIMEVLLGRPDNYALLQIPPRVWYGFTAAGSVPAVICNCPDIPHDPAENTLISICLYVNFNIHHAAEQWICQKENSFCKDDLFRLNMNSFLRTIVCAVIVDGAVNSLTFL